MSDEEQPKDDGGGGGAPAWVMTFADLMSLLMCFFVLLLSFSEMDVQKFKQVAGSMKAAYGVQRVVKASDIPKGTSIVMKEFSPAKPEPTVLNSVKQRTTDERSKNLGASAASRYKAASSKKTEADTRKIVKLLVKEISSGTVEVETRNNQIVIRILEKGSFDSGLAELDPNFKPMMKKIQSAVSAVNGSIKVSGHTDNVPISTARFRSNWELSAARAVSVAHELMKDEGIAPDRFEITGYADKRPRVGNDSGENRAKNRRVEITIVQSDDGKEAPKKKTIDVGDEADSESKKALDSIGDTETKTESETPGEVQKQKTVDEEIRPDDSPESSSSDEGRELPSEQAGPESEEGGAQNESDAPRIQPPEATEPALRGAPVEISN